MFLQYGIEDNQNIERDPRPKEKTFCIVCGGSNFKVESRFTYSGGKKYWITCNDCDHFTTYTFCGKCKTRLIKNGSKWTYHATDVLEPINVKCPYCGDMF